MPKAIGKNQVALYGFLKEYPGWKSISPRCRATMLAAKGLLRKGLVEDSGFNQLRYKEKHEILS